MYMLLIVICEDNLAQLMNVKITWKIILKIIFLKITLISLVISERMRLSLYKRYPTEMGMGHL